MFDDAMMINGLCLFSYFSGFVVSGVLIGTFG
jgi:hypothetical protein